MRCIFLEIKITYAVEIYSAVDSINNKIISIVFNIIYMSHILISMCVGCHNFAIRFYPNQPYISILYMIVAYRNLLSKKIDLRVSHVFPV